MQAGAARFNVSWKGIGYFIQPEKSKKVYTVKGNKR
jgi:hypothetical protein